MKLSEFLNEAQKQSLIESIKKGVFMAMIVIGFVLLASESETVVPNMIGLGMFAYSFYQLGTFSSDNNNQ